MCCRMPRSVACNYTKAIHGASNSTTRCIPVRRRRFPISRFFATRRSTIRPGKWSAISHANAPSVALISASFEVRTSHRICTLPVHHRGKGDEPFARHAILAAPAEWIVTLPGESLAPPCGARCRTAMRLLTTTRIQKNPRRRAPHPTPCDPGNELISVEQSGDWAT
jgi:hypothetical protein